MWVYVAAHRAVSDGYRMPSDRTARYTVRSEAICAQPPNGMYGMYISSEFSELRTIAPSNAPISVAYCDIFIFVAHSDVPIPVAYHDKFLSLSHIVMSPMLSLTAMSPSLSPIAMS